VKGQVDDLFEGNSRAARKKRTRDGNHAHKTQGGRLIETFGNWSEVFAGGYRHREVETAPTHQILRDSAEAEFDVLIGINLLREGLGFPESVSWWHLEDDKDGFCGATHL